MLQRAIAVLVGALTGVLIVAAPVAASPEDLEISSVSSTADGVVVDLVVPRAAAGRTLGDDAFVVTIDGEQRAVSVTRWIDEAPVLDLVVSSGAGADGVDTSELRGALVELIAQLPAQVALRTISAGGVVDHGTDRASALASMRDLVPGDPAVVAQAWRGVTATANGEATAPTGPVRVAIVYPAPASTPAMEGYRAVIGIAAPTAASLLDNADAAVRRLVAGYRLVVAAPDAGTDPSVAVRLDTPDVTASASAVPARPEAGATTGSGATTGADGTSPRSMPVLVDSRTADAGSGVPLWPLLVVAGVIGALIAAVVGWRARRRAGGPHHDDVEVHRVPPVAVAPLPPVVDRLPSEPSVLPVAVTPPESDSSGSNTTAGATTARGSSSSASSAALPVSGAAVGGVTEPPHLVRAAATAELALSMWHAFRSSVPTPMSRDVATAIEAAASAWIDDPAVDPDEVVRLLDADRRGARASSLAAATRLETLSRSVDADHPTLLADARVAVAIGRASADRPDGGAEARALVAVRSVGWWERDRVPLVVSPSLAMADSPFAPEFDDSVGAALVLRAVEDAALRMLRAEEALAGLRRLTSDGFGQRDPWSRAVVAASFANPVVDLASTERALGTARPTIGGPGPSVQDVLADLVERGWLRAVGHPDSGSATVWVADGVLDAVTRPFSPHHSPRQPRVDLRAGERSTDRVTTF